MTTTQVWLKTLGYRTASREATWKGSRKTGSRERWAIVTNQERKFDHSEVTSG